MQNTTSHMGILEGEQRRNEKKVFEEFMACEFGKNH
jgi:hypothetical protein